MGRQNCWYKTFNHTLRLVLGTPLESTHHKNDMQLQLIYGSKIEGSKPMDDILGVLSTYSMTVEEVTCSYS